jgi:hypothetical protein
MIESNKIVGFPKELEMHMQRTSISLIIHYLWQYLPKHCKAKQGFESKTFSILAAASNL